MTIQTQAICRLCGHPVDADGLVALDPLDGRPMHTICREDVLAGKGAPKQQGHNNDPTPAARKKWAAELRKVHD